MKLTVYIFLALLMATSCGSDESDSPLTLPSNLQINVVMGEEGSGQVTVSATADNANFYNVFFGESASESGVKITTGAAAHTYEESGTYTIKVRAHATEAAFVEETESVTITLTPDGGVVIPTTGYSTPLTYAGMKLVWQEEFNGTSLDESAWTFEYGNSGWGNNELEYYRKENTSIQDGNLVITAKQEVFSGANYTSSRIKTAGKKEFQYGRLDFRAVLPKGQGIWPAMWMLGANIATVPWPDCGEIDVMELVGGGEKDNTVHGTAHWGDNGRKLYGNSKVMPAGSVNNEFHVYSILWDETKIVWYVDDVQFHIIDITPPALSELKNPHFILINLAVGGDWPGSPNASTVFPQHLIVDYVRVFQKN